MSKFIFKNRQGQSAINSDRYGAMCTLHTDRQKDKQTNRKTATQKEANRQSYKRGKG